MNLRTLSALALLPSLVACGLLDKDDSTPLDSEPVVTDDSDPAPGTAMTPGTYNLTFEQVFSDTCGYQWQTGVAERVTLDATADEIEITSANGTFSFDVSGNDFSRELDEVDSTYAPCYIRITGDEEGEIVGPEFAEFTSSLTQATEGDCSDYDVSGFPCSYSLGYRLERVGD